MERRRFLSLASGVSIGVVAGCLSDDTADSSEDGGGTDTDDGDDGASASAVTNVEATGTELAVELDAEAAVSSVELVTPAGESWDEVSVDDGQTAVSFDLVAESTSGVTASPPGEYELVAVDGNDESRQPVTIEPSLAATGAAVPDELPEGDTYESFWRYASPVVAVRNDGSGPAVLTDFAVTGESVPIPRAPAGTEQPRSPWDEDEDEGVYAFYHGENRINAVSAELLVPVGETVLVQAAFYPFGISNSDDVTTDSQAQEQYGGMTFSGTATLYGREDAEASQDLTVRLDGQADFGTVLGSPNPDAWYFDGTTITNTSIDVEN